MAANPNTGLTPAPLATPITDKDEFGTAYQNRAQAIGGTLAPSWIGWFNQVQDRLSNLPALQGTHSQRITPVATTSDQFAPEEYRGILFYETDRKVFYISTLVSNVWTWVYAFGEMNCTQANLPADLGANDRGFVANVVDYKHKLVWGVENPGSAYAANWDWKSGDGGSGFMALFEVDPGTGWKLYDGSTVNYLKSDGTTGSVTLPDLAGTAAYLKAGGTNSGPNAAVAPTLHITATTGGPSGTSTVQSGSGATVASSGHTHVVTITSATADADGEPRNLVRRPWFRQ